MKPLPPRTVSQARPILAAVVVGALGALASCGGDRSLSAWDDAACAAALKGPDAVDAFTWFKDPYGGPKRLGAFSNDEGLAFAYALEMKGAKRVVAVGVARVTGPDAHERAAGLVVELPDEPEKRLALFRMGADQVRSRGYRAQPDVDQTYLYLPWR